MNLQTLRFLVFIAAALGNVLSVGDVDPLMTLEVRLHGKTLFKSEFSMPVDPPGSSMDGPYRTLSFSFRPEQPLVWMHQRGVTVTPIRTAAGQEISCSIAIWPAESGSTRSIISASCSTDTKSLTIVTHIVQPKKRARSEIVPGLLLWTCPAER